MSLTEPFDEFERIARNRPHGSIDKAYPKTTDGTTASIIRKTPHRVIQQLPTGKVISDSQDWLTLVASFIFTHKIIPYANQQYNLLQKSWSVVEKALTFGACATYTPFLEHNSYFCPDLTIPFWGDVFLQPGKLSDADCNYIFLRSWWRKEDIESLIDKESKLASRAKKRKEAYDSTWDTANLEQIKTLLSQKDDRSRTPQEKERTINKEGAVEFVTGFQRGVGATFYTFNPQSKLILRKKVNKDPRGELPIQFMYGDIDGSNPLGRGVVELVGGLQNLMDAEMQMYQYNRALMLNPPIIVKGGVNKNKVKFIPNIVIDAGSNPDAKIETLDVDSSAIANFPNNYGLMKSQLLNLLASPDASTSATVGNPGFSKTDAGVKQIDNNVSVDDNYVRKQFEGWFQRWGEGAINMWFAEHTGIEMIQLDKQTAAKLRQLPNFDTSLITDDDQIQINYDDDTEVLTFRVDPSTTSLKDSAEQVQNATALLDLTMKYPQLNSNFGGPIDIDELARRIVNNSSIDDPEQVAPEPTEAQKAAKEQQKNQPNPFSPMFDKPSIRMNYPDLPPAAQVQLLGNAGIKVSLQDVLAGPVLDPNMRGVMNPASDPNAQLPSGGTEQPAQAPAPGQLPQTQAPGIQPQDQPVIDELTKMGANPDQIGRALAMLHQGHSPQEIIQMLGVQG